MHLKVVLSVAATVLTIVSYVPYIRDMRRGRTKPHAFSWLIWTVVTYVTGAAQLAAGGGLGAMVAFTTGTIAAWIAYYSFRHRAVRIRTGDWVSLGIALGAIPVWLATKQPLLSVIIVSAIDLVAFWITIRKTYNLPYSENLTQNILATIKHALTLAAQGQYNPTTLLYPSSLTLMNGGFCLLLIARRRHVTPPQPERSQALPS